MFENNNYNLLKKILLFPHFFVNKIDNVLQKSFIYVKL